jgi:hypothetical protein
MAACIWAFTASGISAARATTRILDTMGQARAAWQAPGCLAFVLEEASMVLLLLIVWLMQRHSIALEGAFK